MMLPVNRLNQRVTIEQPTYTPDTLGGQDISWSALATVFAEVKPIGTYTTARNLADAAHQTAGYRVTIRYRADVTSDMRLQWKTHTLKISAMHEADALLELLAYEETI